MKRTGKEWNDIINKPHGVTIVDPDGWDMTNNSFEELRISRREFLQRNIKSSMLPIGMDKAEAHAFLTWG